MKTYKLKILWGKLITGSDSIKPKLVPYINRYGCHLKDGSGTSYIYNSERWLYDPPKIVI